MNNELDWKNLSFGYIPTDYNVRCYYRDGKWGDIEVSQSEEVNLHIAATCLHYGQEIFEGLKAFRGKDGKIRKTLNAFRNLPKVFSCSPCLLRNSKRW